MTVPYQVFPVLNQRTGVDLGIDPWLTPQDAYQNIFDAFQYLGVITKRDGYSWFDSMPHAVEGAMGNEYQNIDNITTTVSAVVTTHGPHGLVNGQLIRLTDVLGIIIGSDGVPINGTRWTVTVTGTDTFTLNNAVAFGGSYTNNSGTLSIFPGNAIMAIAVWVDESNLPNLMVLDTRRAAIYNNTGGYLEPIGYTNQFTGGDSECFWWENYFGKIYFTNNKDPIHYYSGVEKATGLVTFTPQYILSDSDAIVKTCLMIKAINQRLCLYNTVEDDVDNTRFPTRIRYCQALVDPTAGTDPDLGSTFWDQVTPGRGGFDQLTDSLYIISQGQIQTNNLIFSQDQQFGVLYEQRNTSDPKNPFSYVKIAVSRNVNSTFGTVVLDREVQAVGNTGLILTDGNAVGRYDDKIPQFAINIMAQDNFRRAFGVRNDAQWQSWLLFTSEDSPNSKNDQVLVFNYQDRSWQIYRMPLSCAGNFPYAGIDPAWSSYGSSLPDLSWQDFGEATWSSLPQAQTTMLLGGGYDGNIWWMNQGGGDRADNVAYAGIIPPGFTSEGDAITMDLFTRQWFPYIKEATAAQFGYIDFLVDADPTTIVTVSFNVDNETTDYLSSDFSCVPFEDIDFSTIISITQASPALVTSIDHGLVTGQVVYIFSVQGMEELNNTFYTVTVLNPDQITLDGVDSTSFNAYTGGGIISESGITQTTFWTRVWSGQTGVFHQMHISTSGTDESFRLHAALPAFKPTGRIYKG